MIVRSTRNPQNFWNPWNPWNPALCWGHCTVRPSPTVGVNNGPPRDFVCLSFTPASNSTTPCDKTYIPHVDQLWTESPTSRMEDPRSPPPLNIPIPPHSKKVSATVVSELLGLFKEVSELPLNPHLEYWSVLTTVCWWKWLFIWWRQLLWLCSLWISVTCKWQTWFRHF